MYKREIVFEGFRYKVVSNFLGRSFEKEYYVDVSKISKKNIDEIHDILEREGVFHDINIDSEERIRKNIELGRRAEEEKKLEERKKEGNKIYVLFGDKGVIIKKFLNKDELVRFLKDNDVGVKYHVRYGKYNELGEVVNIHL